MVSRDSEEVLVVACIYTGSGRCTMPLTNIYSDLRSDLSSGLCTWILYFTSWGVTIYLPVSTEQVSFETGVNQFYHLLWAIIKVKIERERKRERRK